MFEVTLTFTSWRGNLVLLKKRALGSYDTSAIFVGCPRHVLFGEGFNDLKEPNNSVSLTMLHTYTCKGLAIFNWTLKT